MNLFEAAVARECLVVREAVGVMDVSTLGKIDIQGPDAGAFLDRIYTNQFSTLKVGARRGTGSCAASTAWSSTTARRLASPRTAST